MKVVFFSADTERRIHHIPDISPAEAGEMMREMRVVGLGFRPILWAFKIPDRLQEEAQKQKSYLRGHLVHVADIEAIAAGEEPTVDRSSWACVHARRHSPPTSI